MDGGMPVSWKRNSFTSRPFLSSRRMPGMYFEMGASMSMYPLSTAIMMPGRVPRALDTEARSYIVSLLTAGPSLSSLP